MGMPKLSRWGRRGVVVFGVLSSVLGVLWAVGEGVIHAAHSTVGAPPADFPAQTIRIPTTAGESVAGWLLRGKVGKGVVLLLHGVRADRRVMLARARFLHASGYSVVLIDLPAHGESTGAYISYGYLEAQALKFVWSYLLAQFPKEKIGVIAVSLGAASFVLSKPNPAPSAVVLESMFSTLDAAVTNRAKGYLGSFGEWVSPAILAQFPLRLGVSPAQLRPLEVISELHAPLLIASGAADPYTPLEETQRIFAAANPPKELWALEGAKHVDLCDYDFEAYQARVGAFLERYLQTSK
jgi:uncharacterized protein